MWEVVDEFKAGVVIKPQNSQEIVYGINKILKNYNKYIEGIRNYQKQASWVNVAKKYVNIYKEIITS